MKVTCDCFNIVNSEPTCYGVRWTSRCSCGGDRSKCDFYPEHREDFRTDNASTIGNVRADDWVRIEVNNDGTYIKELEKSPVTKDGRQIGFVESVSSDKVVLLLQRSKSGITFNKYISMELKGGD